MGAGDRELGDREDAAAGAGRGRATAGDRQPLDTVRDDPAVDHAEAARAGGRRRRGRRGPFAAVVRGDDRVVGVQHERAGRVDSSASRRLARR